MQINVIRMDSENISIMMKSVEGLYVPNWKVIWLFKMVLLPTDILHLSAGQK